MTNELMRMSRNTGNKRAVWFSLEMTDSEFLFALDQYLTKPKIALCSDEHSRLCSIAIRLREEEKSKNKKKGFPHKRDESACNAKWECIEPGNKTDHECDLPKGHEGPCICWKCNQSKEVPL